MKQILMGWAVAGLWLGAAANPAPAQEAESDVMAVVEGLFDAMRAADSAAVRAFFHPELERIGSSATRGGVAGVAYGRVDDFVHAVGGAEPGAFDERIGPSDVRIEDNLATVFTPYAFYFNGDLSHCGVNVFLIARQGEGWTIVGLVDTRRREGCEEWLK